MAGGGGVASSPGILQATVKAALVAAFALVAFARPAAAGSRVTEPYPVPAPDTLGALHLPSPDIATRRSVYNTFVPLAIGAGMVVGDVASGGEGYLAVGGFLLGTAGVVVGPATGYAYGGLGGRAALGVCIRLGLVVGLPIAAYYSSDDQGGEEAAWTGFYGVLLGGALALGSAAIDIVTVHGAVEQRNRERAAARGVSLGPAVAPFSGAPGIAVSLPLGPGAR
jgi:hypothetical protein